MAVGDTLRMVVAPPHPAGRPFILVGIVGIALGLAVGTWLSWLGLIFTLFCLYFFRDPERVAPGRPGAVLAPADGRVVSVAPAAPPAELGLGAEPRWRVGIFLSVLDVHVNRVPADGTVTRIAYRHGAFVNAAPGQGARGQRAQRHRDPPAGRAGDRGGADRRPDRAPHPVRHARGRRGARRRAVRHHPLRQPHRPLSARGVRPLVAEGQTMIGGETVIAELGMAATVGMSGALRPGWNLADGTQGPDLVSPMRRLRTGCGRANRPRFKGPSFNRMVPNIMTMLGLVRRARPRCASRWTDVSAPPPWRSPLPARSMGWTGGWRAC